MVRRVQQANNCSSFHSKNGSPTKVCLCLYTVYLQRVYILNIPLILLYYSFKASYTQCNMPLLGQNAQIARLRDDEIPKMKVDSSKFDAMHSDIITLSTATHRGQERTLRHGSIYEVILYPMSKNM